MLGVDFGIQDLKLWCLFVFLSRCGGWQGGFVYVPFGLEVSCFYLTAHCMVKDELSICFAICGRSKRCENEHTRGRKCDGVEGESKSHETLNGRKLALKRLWRARGS